MRSVNACKPYTTLRKATLTMLPEMHSFTGRVMVSAAADAALMTSARNEMNAFLEDNLRIEKMEADERRMAAAEDEYSFAIMDATFATRVNDDKRQYLSMAETAYRNAIEKMTSCKAFIDSTAAKGAEADARYQKMQTEGVARAVQLVRQYKPSTVPFSPPTKDSFRFKYSFSFKGAKPPAPKAEETFVEKVEEAAEGVVEAIENVV
jgi:hypothetical protein